MLHHAVIFASGKCGQFRHIATCANARPGISPKTDVSPDGTAKTYPTVSHGVPHWHRIECVKSVSGHEKSAPPRICPGGASALPLIAPFQVLQAPGRVALYHLSIPHARLDRERPVGVVNRLLGVRPEHQRPRPSDYQREDCRHADPRRPTHGASAPRRPGSRGRLRSGRWSRRRFACCPASPRTRSGRPPA